MKTTKLIEEGIDYLCNLVIGRDFLHRIKTKHKNAFFEKVKLFLITNNMILDIENLKDLNKQTKKATRAKNEFNKVAWHMINTQNQLCFTTPAMNNSKEN